MCATRSKPARVFASEDVVRGIVEEGPARIKELIELGMSFTERENGHGHELDLGKEGGHSKRRILHAKDITGREIETALLTALALHPNVEMFENHAAIDLITRRKLGFATDNRCVGVYVLDNKTRPRGDGRRAARAAGHRRLRQGLSLHDEPRHRDRRRRGHGLSRGRAGGEHGVHPVSPDLPVSSQGEVVSDQRGGAGRRRHPAQRARARRSWRACIRSSRWRRATSSRARSMRRSSAPGAECVYLDITHKSREFLQNRFPAIYAKCLEFGIDMAVEPIPVVPGAHYQCGGVVTTPEGRTELPGLWAVGEVGCTGLHGANRLASNSLLEALVVAHRAAEAVTAREGAAAAEGHPAVGKRLGAGSRTSWS